MKNCVGNAEGISHGQRSVAAGCRVCGMGYEMVGLRFAFQKKMQNAACVLHVSKDRAGVCKTQAAFVIVICHR